ncbi:hypothetical protein DY000_02042711, partial [Brassica cretica]
GQTKEAACCCDYPKHCILRHLPAKVAHRIRKEDHRDERLNGSGLGDFDAILRATKGDGLCHRCYRGGEDERKREKPSHSCL